MDAALALLRSQRYLVGRFRSAGATTPAAAKTLDELGMRATMTFSWLGQVGVFVREGDERWWLNTAAWERLEGRQTRHMLLSLGAFLAACALAFAVWMLW